MRTLKAVSFFVYDAILHPIAKFLQLLAMLVVLLFMGLAEVAIVGSQGLLDLLRDTWKNAWEKASKKQ